MPLRVELVSTDAAPKAIGPYSQAVIAGELVFVSGQIPLDPATGEMVAESFEAQVKRALANVGAVLQAAGSGLTRVVKVNVYLTDMDRFAAFNQIYSQYFGEHRPARAVVQVSALPRGAQVEVEAVAAL